MAQFVVWLLLLIYAVFWGYQFLQLLMLSDADLPGRYDKLCWTAIFLAAAPAAPILFMYWKGAYLALRKTELGDGDESQ